MDQIERFDIETIYVCLIEMFEKELFDHLTVSKKMFNWIVSDSYHYLEPFNFVNLC